MSKSITIYGISSKFAFGEWNYSVHAFYTEEDAVKWLHTEEYDFRERELMTKSKAIKTAGRKAVENAIIHDGGEVYYPYPY